MSIAIFFFLDIIFVYSILAANLDQKSILDMERVLCTWSFYNSRVPQGDVG